MFVVRVSHRVSRSAYSRPLHGVGLSVLPAGCPSLAGVHGKILWAVLWGPISRLMRHSDSRCIPSATRTVTHRLAVPVVGRWQSGGPFGQVHPEASQLSNSVR